MYGDVPENKSGNEKQRRVADQEALVEAVRAFAAFQAMNRPWVMSWLFPLPELTASTSLGASVIYDDSSIANFELNKPAVEATSDSTRDSNVGSTISDGVASKTMSVLVGTNRPPRRAATSYRSTSPRTTPTSSPSALPVRLVLHRRQRLHVTPAADRLDYRRHHPVEFVRQGKKAFAGEPHALDGERRHTIQWQRPGPHDDGSRGGLRRRRRKRR